MRLPLVFANANAHAIAALVLVAAVGSAADQPAPVPPSHGAATVPGNGGVDSVTARRAEKAAQDYLDQQEANKTPPDPEATAALADAEVLLLEAKTFLDQGDTNKAGTKYVEAAAKLKTPGVQGPRLNERYRRASTKLTELSRALLTTDAVDPASAAKDPGATSLPEAPLPPGR